MLRKWNRFLAVILAMALMATTFNSNVASLSVYADDDGVTEEVKENTTVNEPNQEEPEDEPVIVEGEGEEDEPDAPAEGGAPGDGGPVDGEGGPTDGDGAPVDGGANDGKRALPVDGQAIIPEGGESAPEGEAANPEEKEEEEEAEAKAEGEEEEEEEPEVVVNNITINYVANEGGEVSIPSDTFPEGGNPSEVTAKESEGYTFVNWTDADNVEVCGDRAFTPADGLIVDGATYYANFEQVDFTVTFMVDGSAFDSRGFSRGDSLTIPPQDPFKAGYFFRGWKYGDNLITHDNASEYSVTSDMILTAELEEIRIFEVTVNYYYNRPNGGGEFVFDSQIVEIEKNDLPATVVSPDETQVAEDPNFPVYYPTATSIEITSADLDDIKDYRDEGSVVVAILNDKAVQYIPYEFSFWYTYMLKNLDGNGYTKVKEVEAFGVKNTQVTPKVIDIEGGEFEYTNTYTVTQSGQELPVYYTRANYRLEFDSNGGSYIEAETAPYETVIDISGKEPTYKGYEFGGWYTDEACTIEALDDFKLEKDTVLYAKWNPANAGYTLVYMIENANDDEYSYLGTVSAEAQVGTTVKANASSSKPSSLDTRNFVFKDSSQAVVKADGSTAITVRYNRKRYTVSWNGDVYNINSWRRATGQGSASVTAKYEQDISHEFNQQFMVNKNHKYAWCVGCAQNNKKIVSWDTMPSVYDSRFEAGFVNENTGVITAVAFDFSTTKTQKLYYWLENYDGSQTTTYGGKTYGLFNYVEGHFNFLYENVDFYEIAGYTKGAHVFSKKNYSWGQGTPDGEMRVDLYYNAAKYPLTFINYDGTNISTEQVTLGSNITSKFTAAKNAAAKPASDAAWDKWYTDSNHTMPYDGDYKMPTGLVLYANWIIPDRHITFVKVDPVNGAQSNIQTDTYKHNETASSITPAAIDGFTFGGWYVDADFSEKYDFNKPLTKDISVYTYWIPDEISFTVRFVTLDGEDEIEVAASRTERSPAFKPGDVKVVKAASVVGMLPDASEKEITLTNGSNIVTFYYQAKPDEITYKVRYIYMDGSKEIEVAPEYVNTVSGSQASITVAAVEADPSYMSSVPAYADYADRSYYPEKVVQTHIFTYTDTDNIITFYYHPYKMGTIIVNYKDMDGNDLADPVTKRMQPGGQYSISTSLGDFILNRIEDENGQVVTSTKVIAVEGTVERTVYYQRKLTIGANGKTKTYDGTPLVSKFVAADYYVVGLADGHSITDLTFEGSQTDVGESKTTPCGAVISGPVSADYYVIEYKSGTLTVTPADNIVVNIIADNINVEYDGQIHTAKYTVESIIGEGFKEEYIGHTGETSISSKDVTDQQLAAHFFVKEEYAKNFTNVSFNVGEGRLTITPKALTVTTPDVVTTYPEPATSGELSDADARAAVQGWVGNDGGKLGNLERIKYNVIDDDDLIDENGNHYYKNLVSVPEIIFDNGTNAANYTIDWEHSVMGKLIVKPRPITVVVTGHVSNPDPIVFDAQPHTVSGYDIKVDSTKPEDRAYRVTGDVLDFAGPGQGEIAVTQGSVGNWPLGLKEDASQFKNINSNYEVTFKVTDGHLNIVPADKIVVEITGNSDTVIYNGKEQFVKGYDIKITNDPSGLYTLDKVTKPTQDSIFASGTDVGNYDTNLVSTMFQNTDGNFDVTFDIKNGKLKIEKAKIEVEITGKTNDTTYNGEAQSAKGYDIDGVWLVNTADRQDAKELYAAFTGPGQDDAVVTETNASPDKYMMGLKDSDFTNTDTTNFDVKFVVTDGWLKIDKLPVTVTITGNSDSVEYSGEEQSVSGYSASADSALYLDEYYTAPAQDAEVVTAKGTDADTYTMKVTADDFAVNENPANANFDVTFDVTPGTLEIYKNKTEVTVKVKGNSATEVYDSTLKTVDGWVTVGEFDPSITVQLKADKLAHAEGTDVNLDGYLMGLEAGDFEASSKNFEKVTVVLEEDGKLIITPAKDRPVPTVTGFEGEYDAAFHTVTLSEGGRIEGDQIIYTYVDPKDPTKTIDAEAAPSIKNVSESIGLITVTIKNKNYEDVVLDPVPLNILKRTVTVTTQTASKKYDGYPLTASGSITGILDGDTYTFTVTGKVTKPSEGTKTNTYTLDWGTTDQGNYTLRENLGTLTVTDRPLDERFVIYATPLDGGSVVYDGKEKKDFDYTLSWETITTEQPDVAVAEVIQDDGNIFTRAANAVRTAATKAIDFIADLFTIKSDAKEKADTYSDGGRTFNATVNAEVVADRTAKNVGDYTLSMDESTLGNFTVTDADGDDVTRQFVVKEKGTAALKITPAPVTVKADNKSKTAGGKEPELTAQIAPENPDLYAEALETIKYKLSRKEGETAGKYPITATGDAEQGNFAVTYLPGELVITGGGGGGGTPTPGPSPDPTPTTIPDAPTPAAATPAGTVLGARRETESAAVLGARRGRTEDETNTTARIFAIIVAAAIAASLLVSSKKKEEKEEK